MYKLLYIMVLMLMMAACGVRWVEAPITYEEGDHIAGERLRLSPLGDFQYERWRDHYREAVDGSYELKGQSLLLHAAVYDDSLHIEERIVGGDSTRIRLEIWNNTFKERLSELTNVRLELLRGDSVVAEATAERGEAAFAPEIDFTAWRLTASGLLLRETYRRRHPKANFFYGQYRFGNQQTPHLHFDATRWRYSPRRIQSRLYVDGKERKNWLVVPE